MLSIQPTRGLSRCGTSRKIVQFGVSTINTRVIWKSFRCHPPHPCHTCLFHLPFSHLVSNIQTWHNSFTYISSTTKERYRKENIGWHFLSLGFLVLISFPGRTWDVLSSIYSPFMRISFSYLTDRISLGGFWGEKNWERERTIFLHKDLQAECRLTWSNCIAATSFSAVSCTGVEVEKCLEPVFVHVWYFFNPGSIVVCWGLASVWTGASHPGIAFDPCSKHPTHPRNKNMIPHHGW